MLYESLEHSYYYGITIVFHHNLRLLKKKTILLFGRWFITGICII